MLLIGGRAPAFELTSINGERYLLSEKLTLAIFFKTTCPTCQYAWPYYERFYRAYGSSGLEVWGISQHDCERTREYALTYGATFPHLVDEDWKVSRQYDPEFVPTVFLIDKQKKILETFVSWNVSEFKGLSSTIASLLRVPPQEIIKPKEDVVIFKPG